jgi:predicted metal-dependent phosphotriesterase family hydrolase
MITAAQNQALTSERGGFVRAVGGDLAPGELGLTLCHEHLMTKPSVRLQDGGDMVLDDERRAVDELLLFAGAGGSALIELTVPEFGRDSEALKRISAASGVHVIATTGHVSEDYWQGVLEIPRMTESQLVDEMVRDLTEGCDGTAVRAGIIKAGSSHNAVSPAERRVLRAAAKAQAITGAPITTHTTAGTMAAEQARILVEAGADPRRVCLGHLDRRLAYAEHRALASDGFLLGYDCFSKDWYEPDAARVDCIIRLCRDGLAAHLCVSGDLARRSQRVAWGGGPGYTFIPWRIVPWLRREGASDEDIEQIMVGNPRRLLTWQ